LTSGKEKDVSATSENATEEQENTEMSSEDPPIYDTLAPAPPPPAPPPFMPAAPSAPPLPGVGSKFKTFYNK